MENENLDDSLTCIQWLCELESNEIANEKTPKSLSSCNSSNTSTVEKQNDNPYPKPHLSYATLIVLAINSACDKRMTLQGIYSWIEDNFPYYKHAKKGWKNSIRHNLSLHKFFVKEQRVDAVFNKGSFWRISNEGKENIVRNFLIPKPKFALSPPITVLPPDPNRKLRPILPKPADVETSSLPCSVSLANYITPYMFVPNASETEKSPLSQLLSTCEAISEDNSTSLVSTVTEWKSSESATSGIGVNSLVLENHGTSIDANTSYPASSHAVHANSTQTSESTLCVQARTTANLVWTNAGGQLHHKNTLENLQTTSGTCSVNEDASNEASINNEMTPCSSERTSEQERSTALNSKRLPNILRRKRKFVKSPEKMSSNVKTPLKNSLQSTLAAINFSNNTPFSPNFPTKEMRVAALSPSGQLPSTDYFQQNVFGSPNFSLLPSPVSLMPTLTPLHQSDFYRNTVSTPVKCTLSSTGLTPASCQRPNASTKHQSCRKSLGLDKLDESVESINDVMDW